MFQLCLQRQCKSVKNKRNRYKITSPVQDIDAVEETHQDETYTVPVQGPVQDINAVEEIHRDETNTVPVQYPVQDIDAVEEIHLADQNYDTLNVKVHVPESDNKIGFRFDKKKGITGNIWLAGIVPGTPADKIHNWSETIMYATVIKYNNEDITCIDDIIHISRQILESKPITFDIEFRIVKKV